MGWSLEAAPPASLGFAPEPQIKRSQSLNLSGGADLTTRAPPHSTVYLLEVDELGLVRVQVEAGAVVADGVPADGRRGVFELLRDVFDQRLAVHAQEGTAHLQTQDG